MKKIIITITIVLTSILFIYIFTKSTQANDQEEIVDEYYPKPIISIVKVGNNVATIEAGIYKYGDITQDGIINKLDLDFIGLLIDNKLSFRDEQKLLADMNKDGIVNQQDINLLQKLIKDADLTYEIKSEELLYCITGEENSSNCTWQEDNTFTDLEEQVYYAYAKNINNDDISNNYAFSISIIKGNFIY